MLIFRHDFGQNLVKQNFENISNNEKNLDKILFCFEQNLDKILFRIEQHLEEWYYVTKIVLTYCEKKLF